VEKKLDVVEQEHLKFGDVIQYDFEESYANLSLKILHGFKWISEFCRSSIYVIKVDEDTFLNVAMLLFSLEKYSNTSEDAVYGSLYRHRRVLRSRKWFVSEKSFPRSFYPDYLSGTAYTLTSKLLPRIVEMARHYRFPLVQVEDAFITGILATETIGAKLVRLPGCSTWGEPYVTPCGFVRSKRISHSISLSTRSVSYKYDLWNALNSFKCK
jgi:hypothetical protein